MIPSTQPLTRRVAAAIVKRGRGTAADLLPDFPDCTLRQLVDALHNAKTARLLSMVQEGRNLGGRNGRTLATYGPYVTSAIGRVSSVFDLGSCFATRAMTQA